MKRLLIYILMILSICTSAEAKTLNASVSLNWDILSQTEISEDINNVRSTIFTDKIIYKNNFKDEIKPFLKNNNNKEDIMLAKIGGASLDNKIVVPFYYKKLMLAYGVIYKNDLKHCYYYNLLGGLFIVETFEKDYDDYPVVSYQYRKNGVLSSVVYNFSKIDQYMYLANKEFVGRWYGKNYYNGNGKVVMTRDLPNF